MPAMIEKKCRNCGVGITVRLADHKRGWGNFCSKSCKAKRQEKRTGQYRRFLNARERPHTVGDDFDDLFYANWSNQDGYDV